MVVGISAAGGYDGQVHYIIRIEVLSYDSKNIIDGFYNPTEYKVIY